MLICMDKSASISILLALPRDLSAVHMASSKQLVCMLLYVALQFLPVVFRPLLIGSVVDIPRTTSAKVLGFGCFVVFG